MALYGNSFYDPTTRAAIDPSTVTSYTASYDDSNNPITGYRDASGKNVSQGMGWTDWLVGQGFRQDLRGGTGALEQYMGKLSKDYGLGEQDFTKALQAYGLQYSPGVADDYGNGGYFSRDPNATWMNEMGILDKLGKGLDITGAGKPYAGLWQNYYDANTYNAQQNDVAKAWESQPKLGSITDDLGSIIAGLSIPLGVGAAMGAFGGSGLFGGADFVGSDWASGLSSAMNPGSAAAAAADVSWGVNPRGGGMDWLDNILGDTGSDWANGISDLGGATGNGGVSIPDGLSWDIPPSGVESLTPTSGGVKQQLLQQMVDSGIPFNQASAAVTGLNPLQLMNAAKALGISGSGTSEATNSTALSRIASGQGTMADWLSLGGTAGTGLLSYLSAQNNTQAMKDLADRSWSAGEPYRAKLAASYADPASFLANSPDIKASVDQGTNALARALSVKNGNPIGSGNALQELQNYSTNSLYGQLGNARQQLANFGGQSALTGAFPQLGSQSADASGNIYNSLANTVSRATQPQTDWQSIMKSFGFANSLA